MQQINFQSTLPVLHVLKCAGETAIEPPALDIRTGVFAGRLRLLQLVRCAECIQDLRSRTNTVNTPV